MITDTDTEQLFSCDGANKNFAIPFQFLEGEETVIKVYKITISTGVAVLLVKDTDYTLDVPATTVTTLGAAFSALYQVKIKRVSPLVNESSFSPGAFPAEAINEQFDRVIMLAQELNTKLSKMFSIGEGNPLTNLLIPLASANKLIGWNAGGTALENKDPLDVATLTANVATLQTQVAALQTLTASHTGSINTNAANITAIDDDLTALTGVVTTLSGALTALGATVANFPAQITDLQAQIDAINDYASDVTQLLIDVASLKASRTTDEANIASLTTRVNNLEAASPLSEFSGSLTILNNQAAPVDIVDATGNPGRDFKRNANGTQLARIQCQIDRRTDSELRSSCVTLLMRFVAETQLWYIARESSTSMVGEPDGVDFSVATDPVTLVGQVAYTSDNMAGASYSGNIKFLGKEIPTGV